MNRLVTKVMGSKQKYLTRKETLEAAGELSKMPGVIAGYVGCVIVRFCKKLLSS